MGIFKIGVSGLGTVGTNVVRLIQNRHNEHAHSIASRAGQTLVITGINARDKTKDRGIDLSEFTWFEDAVALARSPDIDVFVELIGGEDGPALLAIRAALQSGKSVITANKALLARHGMELAKLAEANSATIAFEAAVAGGIPAIKVLREAMAGNRIERVSGILNGTCNYILSRMEQEQLSFDECLQNAQSLGYAEADPSFDIGGFDTGHKLALLASLAFGTQVDGAAVHIEGIETITLADIKSADELGYRIKLLGVAERVAKGIEQRVHPTMVPKASALAQVMGVTNAVSIEGDAVGTLTLIGPGAGGKATASSVLSDLVDLASGRKVPTFGVKTSALSLPAKIAMQTHEGGYYIRLNVHDRPGAVAVIASRIAEENISLESIVQRRPPHLDKSAPMPVILTTYATSEAQIQRVLDRIFADEVIVEKPQIIRLERQ